MPRLEYLGLDGAFSLSVVDYTLLDVIIKLCEGHAVFQRLLNYSIEQMRDIIGFEPVCDCEIIVDRD